MAEENTENPETPETPETVNVDGQDYDLNTLISDHQNKAKWQQENTRKAQEVAAERKALQETTNKALDLAAEQNRPPATPRLSLEDEIKALGDPLENANHAIEVARIMDRRIQEATRATTEVSTRQAKRAEANAAAKAASDGQLREVTKDNERLIDDYLQDTYGTSLTSREKDQVYETLSGMQGANFGDVVDLGSGRKVMKFNADSVKRAARTVESLYQREIKGETARSRREGLRGRGEGLEAAADQVVTGPPPSFDSDARRQEAWLRNQDEGTAADYIRNLSKPQRAQLMSHIQGG